MALISYIDESPSIAGGGRRLDKNGSPAKYDVKNSRFWRFNDLC